MENIQTYQLPVRLLNRLSTDDTVRNTTVCDGTVDNAYAHRLAHLFSLSIATYLLFTSFPFVPLSVKVRISRHVRIHTVYQTQ